MPKLPDYIIDDFSGGLVTNKADTKMNRNEFKDLLNFDIDEDGKARRRRGIQQYGTNLTGTTIDDSVAFYQQSSGSPPELYHIAIERSDTADITRFHSTYLTVAAATADTTLTVANNGALAASGNVEINGDIIAYTGKSGATGLTGVTGILTAHPAFSLVNQSDEDITNSILDTRSGVYFCVINNLLFLNGASGLHGTYNGVTFTALTDADRPAGLFATNFRDRVYVAGDSSNDASGVRNGDPRRVSFSEPGDSTSWDVNNFFDVEDDRGEVITGLSEIDDNLLIWKTNSVWTYNEVQLSQRLWNVGAYNNKVVQKIGNVLYTFCPTGIWVTNGFSAKKISDPIRNYLKSFIPKLETSRGRVVQNTFAGQFEGKYYLYIESPVSPPAPASRSDVVLIYDPNRNNWTIHNTYTNFTHFASLKAIGEGDANNSTGVARPNDIEALFSADTSNRYFRLFENTFLDNQATRTFRGSDITGNLKANSIGTPISTVLETALTFTGSIKWKKFGSIKAIIERGNFQISYRLDQGNRITDWISLGNFQSGTISKKLRIDGHQGFNRNEGYRIAIRVTSNSLEILDTLNAIIIEDIETTDKTIYAEYST